MCFRNGNLLGKMLLDPYIRLLLLIMLLLGMGISSIDGSMGGREGVLIFLCRNLLGCTIYILYFIGNILSGFNLPIILIKNIQLCLPISLKSAQPTQDTLTLPFLIQLRKTNRIFYCHLFR